MEYKQVSYSSETFGTVIDHVLTSLHSTSSSGGSGIFFERANFRNASYLLRSESFSSCNRPVSSCISSISRHSCDFSVSSSSFCSMRFMRQLAAYPRFFNVRRRCFMRTISSRVRPLILSVRLRSRTVIDTSSSSLISGMGQGDSGACKS